MGRAYSDRRKKFKGRNISSMEQLRMECILAEKTCTKRETRFMPPPPTRHVRVNELNTDINDYNINYYEDDQVQDVS